MRARQASSVANASMATASVARSPGIASRPSTPSRTNSGMPPTQVDSTGSKAAMASRMAASSPAPVAATESTLVTGAQATTLPVAGTDAVMVAKTEAAADVAASSAMAAVNTEASVTDAQARADEALHEYGVHLVPLADLPRADAIVAAVAHKEYAALSLDDISRRLTPGGAFIDVKAAFDADAMAKAGYRVWRL